MTINILATFGMDLTDEPLTAEYVATAPFNSLSESELELDISGCLIDYEATSIVMDSAIKQLVAQPAPRRLKIIFNIKFPKRLFLKWLFFGSKELKLNIKTATDEVIEKTVIAELKSHQISLDVSILDQESQVLTPFFVYAS